MLRHGAKHDIYLNPETGQRQPVPRHSEIDERLKAYKKAVGTAVILI